VYTCPAICYQISSKTPGCGFQANTRYSFGTTAMKTGLQCFLFCLLFWAPTSATAQPGGFVITDYPDYSPPWKDEAHTEMGIADPEIVYTLGGAREASENEELLNQSYRHLRGAGYSPPSLTPVLTYRATGEQRYRVFQFDFAAYGMDPGNYGYYSLDNNCDPTEPAARPSQWRNWIAVNSTLAGDPAFRRLSGYTHELFHSFQYAYPLFNTAPCPPKWYVEGLADAAANFITEHRFPADFRKNRESLTKASLRSYRVAFQDEEDWIGDPYFRTVVTPALAGHSRSGDGSKVGRLEAAQNAMAYLTSGFWQFLARHSTGLRADKVTTTELRQMLAAWLPLVRSNPPPGIGSRTGWLRLANTYVDKNLPLSGGGGEDSGAPVDALYGWLPEFFTEFATWWEKRHPGFADEPEFWMKQAFGGCETVKLRPGRKASTSTGTVKFTRMAKNSARCMDVVLSGFSGPVALKFSAKGFSSASRTDQLHLGLARIESPGGSGHTVESCWDHWQSQQPECRRLGKASKSPPAKSWKREQFSAKRLKSGSETIDATLTYVLSNVAPHVSESATLNEITITVRADYNSSEDRTFAPPKSVRPRGATEHAIMAESRKETFYGLSFVAPVNASNLFDIELNQIQSGEEPRCGGSGENRQCAYDTGGDYLIHPLRRVVYGQTGPIAASVRKNSEDSPKLSSTFCSEDADLKAVRVLDSSEDGLALRVDTDLCDLPGPGNNFCGRQQTCPVREHLQTTVTLASGREHFAETAPINVLTPGTKFDMNLYFRYGVPTGLAGSQQSGTSDRGMPIIPGSAGAGPTSAGSTGAGASAAGGCQCTCQERQEALERAEELKHRNESGEEVGMGDLAALTTCMGVCQREYLACVMQANTDRRAAKKKPRPAPDTDCDCGCGSLQDFQEAISALSSPGQPPNMQAIKRASECIAACRDEYVKCASR
jgi:hypothetical protein